MAVRFPDIPPDVDPEEAHMNYFFNHLTACIKLGRAPGKLWYPNGVAVDSNNNQIYVTEGLYVEKGHASNFTRVSIFSETGVFLNVFSHRLVKCAYGIAIHKGNVYVTDIVKHFVFNFKIEKHFCLIAGRGGRGSGIGQFNDPRQLTVSPNGDVFVTDCDNNRVKILDSDLHYQRHIFHHSMRYPCDVKLTPDEVFGLCKTSTCVYVFSYIGDLIRSLITRGAFGMQVWSNSLFCLDADGNLLLSDCSCHQIKIFSKEGPLIHTLGERGDEAGMFVYPQGITLNNNLKLVIASRNREYSLQIYSSD